MPRLGVLEQAERAGRADDRRQDDQQRGAERELERRAADRAARGRRELHVGARLEAEQRSDEQQERDGEGFHGDTPKLTAVKLAPTCPRSSYAVSYDRASDRRPASPRTGGCRPQSAAGAR